MPNLLIRFFKNASGSGAEARSLIFVIVMVVAAAALVGLHDSLAKAFETAAALLGGDGGQSVGGVPGN